MFMTFLWVYQTAVICAYFLILAWVFLGLWTGGHLTKKQWYRLNPCTVYLVILHAVIGIVRTIDPYGFYNWLPSAVASFSLWVGIILIITACVLSVAVWNDIMLHTQSYSSNFNFKVTKYIITVFAGLSFGVFIVMYVIFSILGIVGEGTAAFQVVIGVQCLFLIVFILFVIPQLRSVNEKVKIPQVEYVIKLLRILTVAVIVSLLCIAGFIVVNVLFRTNDPFYAWMYFGLAYVTRLVEISCAVLLSLIVIDTPRGVLKKLFGHTDPSKNIEK